MKITINETINLTEEIVSNILASTFTAISYWAEGMYPKDYGTLKKEDVEKLNSDESYAKILLAGGTLEIRDLEGDFEDTTLNLVKLAIGIEKATSKYPHCVDVDNIDMSDDTGCDIIIQLAVFNEIVYG